MSADEVKGLRKAGKLPEAEQAALKALANNSNDFQTKTQFEWVIFDQVKAVVASIGNSANNNQPIDQDQIDELLRVLRMYYRIGPQIPGWACSNILKQLAKIAPHIPGYVEIVDWIGLKGLGPEDWEPNRFEGRSYPSLSMSIARSLCKWVKSRSEANETQTLVALQWVKAVLHDSKDEDKIWLQWDLSILLRKLGEHEEAAQSLAYVVKEKRSEFWVWAEAGRLYQDEQPDLAIACFCRALECSADQKFLVRTHRELAVLLAEQDNFPQASKELSLAIEIREAEGWGIGENIEELIASSWYDPSATGAIQPQEFYASHSPNALALCFDVAESKAATFLGSIVPHASGQATPSAKARPLPRFAVKDTEGVAWTVIGPGMKNLAFEVGEPITVVLGGRSVSDDKIVVHVSQREDGDFWDTLDEFAGVVSREPNDSKQAQVFLCGVGLEAPVATDFPNSIKVGDGVRARVARNPRNDRPSVFTLEKSDLPSEDIKIVHGTLRRNPNGFGFVEDVFVSPSMINEVPDSVGEVAVMAVYGQHPSRDERSWRAISISAGN